MQDTLFDPFNSVTDEHKYLAVEKTEVEPFDSDLPLYSHNIQLDNRITNESRIRYNFWLALGDIGGFHDGLVLLAKFLIGPVSMALFKN